ncbi:MAG: hypothetical protein QOI80_777 [Solirubrobacteraceae bacterium]|nr:hypothetical protein [Solirubrobacteraceae bacterium]
MVELEPLNQTHLEAIERLMEDPETLRRTRAPEPPPPDFARGWIARCEQGRADGKGEAFAAIDDDGTFLGVGLVPELDRDAAEAELGYIVAPEARGRGVATAILRQLTDWAFAQGMQRLQLLIDVGNPASLTVAERAGYIREGIMRSTHHKQGARLDLVLMSRLPTDP